MIENWIDQRVKMISEGFSLEQIQRECWDYCHRECLGIFNLETIIFRSMQLYAEVIKRSDNLPILIRFKSRREKLKLSLRDVSKKTGVSPATISRIERGNECGFGNVKALDNWYSSNGA